jgi:hypothetical protein
MTTTADSEETVSEDVADRTITARNEVNVPSATVMTNETNVATVRALNVKDSTKTETVTEIVITTAISVALSRDATRTAGLIRITERETIISFAAILKTLTINN